MPSNPTPPPVRVVPLTPFSDGTPRQLVVDHAPATDAADGHVLHLRQQYQDEGEWFLCGLIVLRPEDIETVAAAIAGVADAR